jgi:hypothetical protein
VSAPLISIMFVSLIGITSSALISGMVRLIVYIVGDDFRWWTPMERVYASRSPRLWQPSDRP